MTKALRTFGEDRQVEQAKRRFLGKTYGIGWVVALDVLRHKSLVTRDADGDWKLLDPQPAPQAAPEVTE